MLGKNGSEKIVQFLMRYDGEQTFLMYYSAGYGMAPTPAQKESILPLATQWLPLHLLLYLMASKQKQNARSANLIATLAERKNGEWNERKKLKKICYCGWRLVSSGAGVCTRPH